MAARGRGNCPRVRNGVLAGWAHSTLWGMKAMKTWTMRAILLAAFLTAPSVWSQTLPSLYSVEYLRAKESCLGLLMSYELTRARTADETRTRYQLLVNSAAWQQYGCDAVVQVERRDRDVQTLRALIAARAAEGDVAGVESVAVGITYLDIQLARAEGVVEAARVRTARARR